MDKNKHLEKLREMRERAGIIFKKSFNCQDAEKNIHLVDSETFFKKYKKRLFDMGYLPSDDFTFDIIRHRLPWAERHHVGKSYSWKYFYSTTFTIEPEMIDFLEKHLFIFKINTPNEIKYSKKLEVNVNKINSYKESLEERLEKLENNKQKRKDKIKRLHTFINESPPNTNPINLQNWKKGIDKCYTSIRFIDEEILKIKKELNLI